MHIIQFLLQFWINLYTLSSHVNQIWKDVLNTLVSQRFEKVKASYAFFFANAVNSDVGKLFL